MAGLTDAGYTALRTADFFTIMKDAFEADPAIGVTIDFTKNAVLGALFSVNAQQMGEVSEASQMVYDAWVRSNANGLPLDDLGTIVGTLRIQATQSTADFTLTGDATSAGKVVPAGTTFQGGDPVNPTAQWTLDADIILDGTNPVTTGKITSVDFGAIAATAGTIVTIVNPQPGLVSVTNQADVNEGVALETDAEYRIRQVQSFQLTGGSGLNAIRANLTAIPGVTAAGVIDNPEAFVQVIEGIVMNPHSVAATVTPSTLTSAQQDAVAEVLYEQVCDGTETMGDQIKTVTGADGFAKTIKFFFATDIAITVVSTVTLMPGFTLSQVTPTIIAAVQAYFDTLSVGEDVLFHKVFGAVSLVEGLDTVAVTINGGGVNISISVNEVADLISNTVV